MYEMNVTQVNMAIDPRFDTFYKRINLFRQANETDKQFAERLGVSLSTLKRWKQGGSAGLPIVRELTHELNVDFLWLQHGWGTHVKVHSNGFRLTGIPKGLYFLEDFVDVDQQEMYMFKSQEAMMQ